MPVQPPRRKGARVTIREVAEDAGVSVAAVSIVLRNAYGASDALRERVRASVEKLGYRPLAGARGMRGHTYTIGLVFPDIRNPFFSHVVSGVYTALERTQYRSVIATTQSSVATELSVAESLLDSQVDGVLMVGSSEDHDNLATEHLIANGYRSIAMMSVARPTTLPDYRERGYRQAMTEAGLGDRIEIVRSPHNPPEVRIVARKILQRPQPPDAIFCWSDLFALEVLGIAAEMGLRVPQDLAVVGYDNNIFCDLGQNSLTSIDQSGELLGQQATRLLISRIGGRTEPEHFVISPSLVARKSSAARQ